MDEIEKRFKKRITDYPKKRLNESPRPIHFGVASLDIERDMVGFLKVVLDEAKQEYPLIIPSSTLHSKEIIIDQMIDVMKWFEKWFGE